MPRRCSYGPRYISKKHSPLGVVVVHDVTVELEVEELVVVVVCVMDVLVSASVVELTEVVVLAESSADANGAGGELLILLYIFGKGTRSASTPNAACSAALDGILVTRPPECVFRSIRLSSRSPLGLNSYLCVLQCWLYLQCKGLNQVSKKSGLEERKSFCMQAVALSPRRFNDFCANERSSAKG